VNQYFDLLSNFWYKLYMAFGLLTGMSFINLLRLVVFSAAALVILFTLSFNSDFFNSPSHRGNNPLLLSSAQFCLRDNGECHNSLITPKLTPSLRKAKPAPNVTKTIPLSCPINAPGAQEIESQMLSALAKTNLAVDSARQAAENNGESYIAFDNAANNIFEAYNLQVEQAYSGYLNTLHGCPAMIPQPQLFQMFNP
jgi:hypothetical protein